MLKWFGHGLLIGGFGFMVLLLWFFSNLVGEKGPRLACLGHGFKGSRSQVIENALIPMTLPSVFFLLLFFDTIKNMFLLKKGLQGSTYCLYLYVSKAFSLEPLNPWILDPFSSTNSLGDDLSLLALPHIFFNSRPLTPFICSSPWKSGVLISFVYNG